MLSTCPNCLNQVSHEDHLLQVTCECGTTFQTFITDSGLTDEGGASLEPNTMQGTGAVLAPPTGEDAFAESMAFLQDIKEFGEDLGKPAVKAAPKVPPPIPTGGGGGGSAAASSPAPTGERPMTAGDSLPGFLIQGYMGPISTWAELNAEAADPLHLAFEALWVRAQKQGATGIVGVRWNFSPDGARILVSGTPVKGTKAP